MNTRRTRPTTVILPLQDMPWGLDLIAGRTALGRREDAGGLLVRTVDLAEHAAKLSGSVVYMRRMGRPREKPVLAIHSIALMTASAWPGDQSAAHSRSTCARVEPQRPGQTGR
jgi:hypothetical protein